MLKKVFLLLCIATVLALPSVAQTEGALARQANSEITDAIRAETDPKALLKNTGDRLGKAFAIYKSAKEIYEGLEALKNGECLPDYSIDPQAAIPSSCEEIVEGGAPRAKRPGDPKGSSSENKCADCYEAAYNKLNDARRRLERLKCLGLTTKSFVNQKISFGDTVSGGLGGIQGLAWQKARKEILDSYSKFKDAYDLKYRELMDGLTESLQEIDKCEAQNGQKDWFQRFGFIYVEFMAEKYKRVE
ncbi:MAG: hypothetical protein ABL959_05040 [Pyrinomonadaceae bacterium]